MFSLMLIAVLGATQCKRGACPSEGFELWDGQSLQCCTPSGDGPADYGGPMQDRFYLPLAPLFWKELQTWRFTVEKSAFCAHPDFIAVVDRALRNCEKGVPVETVVPIAVDYPAGALGFTLEAANADMQKCLGDRSFTVPPPHEFKGQCTVDAKFLGARSDSISGADQLHRSALRLLQAGKNEEAVELLKKSVVVNDSCAACHRALGIAYARLKNEPKALDHYNRYLELTNQTK